MKNTLTVLGFLLLVVSSCNIINPSEDTPFFVKIPAISVCVADSCYEESEKRGSGAHKIVDAWVYVDDNLLGAFELPATVPVLKSGNVKISVQGGIKNNGIINDAQQYDFYKPYDTYVDGVPGNFIDINDAYVTYRSNLFFWVENFDKENNGLDIETDTGSDTIMFVTNDSLEVFEGKGSGKVVLTDGMLKYSGVSTSKFDLPKGQVVFAEINYKSNNPIGIGLLTNDANNKRDVALYLKPSLNDESGEYEWRKVYIDLSYASSLATTGALQQFYIEMLKISGDDAWLLIDNIKIVHGL